MENTQGVILHQFESNKFLIEKLIAQGFQINAVVEASTICPGEVQDLHQKSGLHARYFKKVLESEKYFFNAVVSADLFHTLACINSKSSNPSSYSFKVLANSSFVFLRLSLK